MRATDRNCLSGESRFQLGSVAYATGHISYVGKDVFDEHLALLSCIAQQRCVNDDVVVGSCGMLPRTTREVQSRACTHYLCDFDRCWGQGGVLRIDIYVD